MVDEEGFHHNGNDGRGVLHDTVYDPALYLGVLALPGFVTTCPASPAQFTKSMYVCMYTYLSSATLVTSRVGSIPWVQSRVGAILCGCNPVGSIPWVQFRGCNSIGFNPVRVQFHGFNQWWFSYHPL